MIDPVRERGKAEGAHELLPNVCEDFEWIEYCFHDHAVRDKDVGVCTWRNNDSANYDQARAISERFATHNSSCKRIVQQNADRIIHKSEWDRHIFCSHGELVTMSHVKRTCWGCWARSRTSIIIFRSDNTSGLHLNDLRYNMAQVNTHKSKRILLVAANPGTVRQPRSVRLQQTSSTCNQHPKLISHEQVSTPR